MFNIAKCSVTARCNHCKDLLNIEYLVLEKQESDARHFWKTNTIWSKARLHSEDLLSWLTYLFSLLLKEMLTSNVLSRITKTFPIFGSDYLLSSGYTTMCRRIPMGPEWYWSQQQIFWFKVILMSAKSYTTEALCAL